MSQALNELCSLLIKDLYGHFHAHIFETLMSRGRLTAPLLAQKSHLSLPNVKAGLSVLIQAHLVFHFTPVDSRTSYQANWLAAYNLVRTGKILRLVEQEYGGAAAQVVEDLLHNGDWQVSSLTAAPEHQSLAAAAAAVVAQRPTIGQSILSPDIKQENKGDSVEITVETASEGHDSGHVQARRKALELLAEAFLIREVKIAHSQAAFDSRTLAEIKVLNNGQAWEIKGSKKKQEFQAAVEKLMSERADGKIRMTLEAQIPTKGVKRSVEEDNGVNPKRQKLSNGLPANSSAHGIETNSGGAVPPGLPFSESLTVQVDAEKFKALLRDEALVSIAKRVGDARTADVYQSLLTRLRRETFSESIADEDDIFEDVRIEGEVSPGVELRELCGEMRSTIKAHHHRQKNTPGYGNDSNRINGDSIDGSHSKHSSVNGEHRQTLVNGDDAHVTGPGESGENPETFNEGIEMQLTLLAEAPHKLAVIQCEAERTLWKVPFGLLVRKLRDQEICRVIKARFGEVAVRLVRVLMEKGKMDERILQELALVTAKEARKILAQLHKAGLIEVQEVPRENQRLPNRTYYFWFYDRDHCQQMVLERIYKSMARCLQRLEKEAEKEKTLLTKAGRTDVRGKEEQFLSKREYKTWTKWRGKEERLLGELNRLDQIVAVLRDF